MAFTPDWSQVAIVAPVLNEEAYVEACLLSLLRQAPDARIMVMDGGSTDATRGIVARLRETHPGVSLLDNPGRLQSAAMNRAAEIAPPEVRWLVRADAHALYPEGFLAGCLEDLIGRHAVSVVTPMRTVGQAPVQRAIAAAQNSRLGNGGSSHRGRGASGPVEHGHHAAFDRAFFRAIGGYDESFSHNEDAEYDHRARLAGGLVWMRAETPVTYFPRGDLWSLARQYRNHGRGRARTLLKHRLWPRLRQMLPLAVLGGTLGGVLLGLAAPVFFLVPLAYALLCLGWGAWEAWREGDRALLLMGPAAMVMHHAWAVGFLEACARRFRPG